MASANRARRSDLPCGGGDVGHPHQQAEHVAHPLAPGPDLLEVAALVLDEVAPAGCWEQPGGGAEQAARPRGRPPVDGGWNLDRAQAPLDPADRPDQLLGVSRGPRQAATPEDRVDAGTQGQPEVAADDERDVAGVAPPEAEV